MSLGKPFPTFYLCVCSDFEFFPTLHPNAVFFSPLSGEFASEGFVEDGGFAGFKAAQCILCLLFGLIQLGKQAFNAVNNALLFGEWWERKGGTCNSF